MKKLHINCDAGEEDAIAVSANFDDAFKFMSAANIACGAHAGSEDIIARTTNLCLINNVQIGLHPSYDDRSNFGRVVKYPSKEELYELVTKQLQVAEDVVSKNKGQVAHVKPHGALYNQTAIDPVQCEAVYKAIADFNSDLQVFGLSGTYHQETSEALGLVFCSEGFGDRSYQSCKALRSRKHRDSVLTKVEDVLNHVDSLTNGKVQTVDEGVCIMEVETICIHGDNANLLSILSALDQRFEIMKSSD